MADRVVVDASVAIAYLLDEIGSPAAQAAFTDWTASSSELIVPSHFWIEVTHVILGRRRLPPDQVVEHLVDLDRLSVRTIEVDRPLLLLAMDQMVRSGLSAYDAVYLALALSIGGRLATLDRRLALAAGEFGLLIGSLGVSEPRTAYGRDLPDHSGWAHSAAVGAHIADLRRAALRE